MKKKLLSIVFAATVVTAGFSQSEEFDQKWRFGLRVTPQPVWFLSSDKNNVPDGASFGSGFGLNVEYRFSKIAGLLWGVGGDFEGGKYTFKNDPAGKYEAMYLRDADQFILPAKLTDPAQVATTTQLYALKSRSIKTTHVTLPLILKLSTAEYNGLKYFGMFGVEIGVRVKSVATDTYYDVFKYSATSTNTLLPYSVSTGQTEEKDIDISEEGSLIPMRLGLNAGIGAEYRLGGTTSAFFSVNYFRSFTNLMSKTSDFTFYRVDDVNGAPSFSFVKQNLKQSAIRINIGILF
jgi:hypothetical protein